MLGRPGAAVFQMNGQPTAQNTRETGADGDLPGMRNWDNEQHVQELARLWNVEPGAIPHWAPPTHAMQIWRYAEQGSIELLWISATNPAVSLPELARVRAILERPELLVVVQDIFLSETAQLADIVLPPPPGARRPARSRTRIAPCTWPSGPSRRRARRARTWRSSSTTRGGWTSVTATARR